MLENTNILVKRSLSTLQLAALDFAITQTSQDISKVFVKIFEDKNPVVFLLTKDLPQLVSLSFVKNYQIATMGDQIQVKAFNTEDAKNIHFLETYGVSRFY